MSTAIEKFQERLHKSQALQQKRKKTSQKGSSRSDAEAKARQEKTKQSIKEMRDCGQVFPARD